MKTKDGQKLLLIDEDFNIVKLSPSEIYFLSHPCTNGNESEADNRIKEAEIYSLLVAEEPNFKAIRPLTMIPKDMAYDPAIWTCYRLLDISYIAIFSPGWQQSKGCKLEHKYCIENGIPRLYLFEENYIKAMSHYTFEKGVCYGI